MKYYYLLLSCSLLLVACSTLHSLQSVDAIIPSIGSVGKVKDGMFSKEFEKVGQPKLSEAIEVGLQSKTFTASSYRTYRKYNNNLGKEVSITYTDSLEISPRYYELKITDLVGIKTVLNQQQNNELLSYLKDNASIKMLTGISFVALGAEQEALEKARYVSLLQKGGRLTVQVNNGTTLSAIHMNDLEVFDFEVSGFCWKNNRNGASEIALLTNDGMSCPSNTERKVEKLNSAKTYLKF